MGRLSELLKKEGITWPQLLFQFVIVLLGVYLAILFERKAEERNFHDDTMVMLQNVLTELEQDEGELEEKLEIQAIRGEAVQALAELLARAAPSEASAVDSLMSRFLDHNRTAFLRKSAYSSLVSGGHLRSLVRTDLPARFAGLYERTYARVEGAGGWQDYQAFEYLIPSYHQHFQVGDGRYIQAGPEANVRFRNAALQLVRNSDFYTDFLETTLAEVRAVKGAVERHLSQG